MKRTSFFGISSRRSCRSSQNHSTSVSSVLLVGAKTWITLILNGLSSNHSEWFGNDQSPFVIFEIAHKYCISDSFVDYEGYSISSKGLLPTVLDTIVI